MRLVDALGIFQALVVLGLFGWMALNMVYINSPAFRRLWGRTNYFPHLPFSPYYRRRRP